MIVKAFLFQLLWFAARIWSFDSSNVPLLDNNDYLVYLLLTVA